MDNTDLDCIGLKCPMPIVRISQALRNVSVGGTLTVHADDPAFRSDVESFVKMTGQALESFSETGTVRTAVILRRQ